MSAKRLTPILMSKLNAIGFLNPVLFFEADAKIWSAKRLWFVRRTLVRIAEQRVLFLRFRCRLFLLLLGGQPFDDRLLTFRVVGPFELEIESRQQDMRLHVIGQHGDDLLEQFDSLVGFALSLDQLR